MAQPNLTRVIHRLEEEIGCALFDRSQKRFLALTPAGQIFLQEIEPLLAQYDHAVQVAQQVSRGDPPQLVVGYTAAAIFSVLPEILQKFQRRCRIQVSARDMSTTGRTALIRALREGRLDVAFVLGGEHVSGIAHELVCQAPLRVVLPADHALAKLEAVPMADLSQEPWVWLPRYLYPRLHDDVMALCQQAGFHPDIKHIASQAQTMVSMVAAHAGIALVTRWSEQGLPQQGVVYRPLAEVTYQADLQMLWRVQDTSPHIHAFLQVARSVRRRIARQEKISSPASA